MKTSSENDAGTRINAAMSAVQKQIASRTLVPGSRLPSIREFARQQGVSKSTIVEAYERLRAEGVIQSRPGAGFFVSAPLAPLSLTRTSPCLQREIDPLWISRQSLDASDAVLKPGCGWLPAHWMPEDSLRQALRKVARAPSPVLADYGSAKGLQSLRTLLARRMATNGLAVSPEQLLLTDSGTQAIDLLCRCLLEAGDTVLVDDPCYFNFHALLKAHRVNVVSVAYTPTGPDTVLLERTLQAHSPRLYVTNSGVHNPTGASLSAETAYRVLRLAEQHDLQIIEDDIFADFEELPAIRLAALDGFRRVCQVGSFSKTISASVRCGYIATPEHLVEELLDLKVATSFSSGNIAAEMTHAVLSSSAYRKHQEALRQRLSGLRSKVARQLTGLGIVPWIEPQAGMYLWCRLPADQDATAVAQEALTRQLILAPGNAFSLSREYSEFLRFNVSQCTDPRVFRILEDSLKSVSGSTT